MNELEKPKKTFKLGGIYDEVTIQPNGDVELELLITYDPEEWQNVLIPAKKAKILKRIFNEELR